MFLCLSYQVIATFGISAVVSFAVSTALLLALAAKQGCLRSGTRAIRKQQVLLPPKMQPTIMAELVPLKAPL